MTYEMDEDDFFLDAPRRKGLECHYCGEELHPNNNAMTRCMDGKEPALRGFGWISVMIVKENGGLAEVPCCDICFDKPETKYAFC